MTCRVYKKHRPHQRKMREGVTRGGRGGFAGGKWGCSADGIWGHVNLLVVRLFRNGGVRI